MLVVKLTIFFIKNTKYKYNGIENTKKIILRQKKDKRNLTKVKSFRKIILNRQ
jgi:hypothetical protein